MRKALIYVVLAFLVVLLSFYADQLVRFNAVRSGVLNYEGDLWELGQHFVVGYGNIEDLKPLIEKGAIGGIYVTRKNVGNRSVEQLRSEIDELQNMQSSYGRRPLIISTDQEGGVVSRLSPPLQQLPGLSSVVADEGVDYDALESYIKVQGEGLESVGINVNFGPVVDINEGMVDSKDEHTRIYMRAISSDADVIGEVALKYCEGLAEYNVICTLKHYPGLGKVKNDTHISSARLDFSLEELQKHELVPFNYLMGKTGGIVMLSHVIVPALDDVPVSISEKIIKELIRGEMAYNGVLITDDFSMWSISAGEFGVERSSLMALNAGVDLVLISYDYNLYYYVMEQLIGMKSDGELDESILNASERRLESLMAQLSYQP